MTASASLSGCVYDVGLGFASDGYYEEGYGCNPYDGHDAYYDCDYGQGFGNIGFGGGWYDNNYYYPGYGIFLFDSDGRRYQMREQYRRYWGEKRHNSYSEHRGRDRDDDRYQRRGPRYNNGTTRGADGRRDRSGARSSDGEDQRTAARREGRSGWGDRARGRDGRGANAVLMPDRDGLDRTSKNRDRGAGAQRAGGPDSRATPSRRALGWPPRENSTGEVESTEPRSKPQRAPRSRDRVSGGGVERPD